MIPQNELLTKIAYAIIIVFLIVLIFKVYDMYNFYTQSCAKNCLQKYKGCISSCWSDYQTQYQQQAPIQNAQNVPTVAAAATTTVIAPSASSFDPKRADPKALETFLANRYDEFAAPESDFEYDYAQIGLEKAVFQSHKEFTDDAYINVQTPSSGLSVRDDTNEINPRWGLRRVDYTSVFNGDDARQVSSEFPEQVEQSNVGTYTL